MAIARGEVIGLVRMAVQPEVGLFYQFLPVARVGHIAVGWVALIV